jgi:hypothetical protein
MDGPIAAWTGVCLLLLGFIAFKACLRRFQFENETGGQSTILEHNRKLQFFAANNFERWS